MKNLNLLWDIIFSQKKLIVVLKSSFLVFLTSVNQFLTMFFISILLMVEDIGVENQIHSLKDFLYKKT